MVFLLLLALYAAQQNTTWALRACSNRLSHIPSTARAVCDRSQGSQAIMVSLSPFDKLRVIA
jgi:hypothetical protein